MPTIGSRIKQIRTENHITQVELGKLIGITGAGVARIESGASNPTEAAIRLICATYHVQYRWLTTGEGMMMEKMDADALIDKYMAGESEFAKSVMRAFMKLPDDEWYKLRDMIDRIKKEGD